MQTETSSIYGPVDSWRFGKSLGVDLLMSPSTCSFNCTYCQLGFIQRITLERKIYVPTDKVINDLKRSNWQEADIITLSGSGEPTLALNIKEVIKEIKTLTQKRTSILTNGTLLKDQSVRNDILDLDVISIKLDSTNDETLHAINRPTDGVSFSSILDGIFKLQEDIKAKNKNTKLQIQIMFMPQNKNQINEIAELLNKITPHEVALNTPTRPYPSGWDIITRGAHGDDAKKIKYPTKPLKQLSPEEAFETEKILRKLTGLNFLSIYKN